MSNLIMSDWKRKKKRVFTSVTVLSVPEGLFYVASQECRRIAYTQHAVTSRGRWDDLRKLFRALLCTKIVLVRLKRQEGMAFVCALILQHRQGQPNVMQNILWRAMKPAGLSGGCPSPW